MGGRFILVVSSLNECQRLYDEIPAPKRMKRVTVICKPIPEAVAAGRDFYNLLVDEGVDCVGVFQLPEVNESELQGVDTVFTFGGDGTLLKTAKLFQTSSPLIVGVNYGRLGFLAEVERTALRSTLNKLLEGKEEFYLVQRLQGEICSDPRSTSPPATNEIFITPSTPGRLISIRLQVPHVMDFSGRMDGLIISTSVGSTAYSLSSGGPILDPDASVVVLAPLAAINMAMRPLVIDGSKVVTVTNVDTFPFTITIDGVKWSGLFPSSSLSIRRFPVPIRLFRSEPDLLEKLFRKRLGLGL